MKPVEMKARKKRGSRARKDVKQGDMMHYSAGLCLISHEETADHCLFA